MARKSGERENYRVVITPKNTIWLSTSGRTDDEITCEKIVEEIKRHVDDVATVEVEYDQTYVCQHCGNTWTEASVDYNGGCCQADEDAHLAAQVQA